jgi:hypothetical protein
MRAAAEHYDEIADCLSEGIDCSWSLALPPEKYNQWTPEMRRDQRERLRTARAHDGEAVSALKRAVDLLQE